MGNVFRRIFPRYNPRAIIIAGWEASGSTFLYQIAKELGLEVYKKHRSRKNTCEDFTLFAFRDPRDVICSHAKRLYRDMWIAEGQERALIASLEHFVSGGFEQALFDSIRMKNVLPIRYETFFLGNERLLVDLIADKFMVKLTDEEKDRILRETSISENAKRAGQMSSFQEYDEDLQIHGFHISNKGRTGAWRESFTPDVTRRVKNSIGNLILRLGYEKDFNWYASK